MLSPEICKILFKLSMFLSKYSAFWIKNCIHSLIKKKLFIIHHTYYQCARDSYLKLNPLCWVKAVNDVESSNHANETPRDKTVHKCMYVLSSRFSLLWSFCVLCDRWWYFVYLILPIGMCRIHLGSWKDVSVKIYLGNAYYFFHISISNIEYFEIQNVDLI